MATGKIKWFNAYTGFGFIVPDDGGKEIFFHGSEVTLTSLDSRDNLLQKDRPVSFLIAVAKKGPKAINFRLI